MFKTTGGKLWVKPWGLRLSPAQRNNRRKGEEEARSVQSALKEAAAREPTPADAAHQQAQ